jgi:hypothetical protein
LVSKSCGDAEARAESLWLEEGNLLGKRRKLAEEISRAAL